MHTRTTGHLSGIHIAAALNGLLVTTGAASGVELDPEERRRLDAAIGTCAALVEETSRKAVAHDPTELRAHVVDERVDRCWGALYRVLVGGARLAGVLPLGDECERLMKTYFATGLDFTALDYDAQLHHGKAKLAAWKREVLSPELQGFVGPILTLLRKEHVLYEKAVRARLTKRVQTPKILASRAQATEALDAFIGYVEIMATTPERRERAEAILAPVTRLLGARRRGTRPADGAAEAEPASPTAVPASDPTAA